jgi:NAD-dependent DNA ligase
MSLSPLDIISRAAIFGTIECAPIGVIIEGLQQADDIFFNDEVEESPLNDAEYDAIRQYAQRIDPTNVYFAGIGSQVRGGKVKLPHTMGSLNQIYMGDYTKWVEKHAIRDETIVISDKLDGNSSLVVYGKDTKLQIAFSRGDGTHGADITRHISKIHNVPKTIFSDGESISIRGEVIITPANFNKIKAQVTSQSGRMYKNPRNFVSGRMNASEGLDIVYAHIDFVAYEIIDSPLSKSKQFELLKVYGFKTARHVTIKAGAAGDAYLTQLLQDSKIQSEYEIDGLVIDVDSVSTRKRISPTKDSLNPEYSVKFKVADASNYAEPTVTGIELNVSKDGIIKPVITFSPVDLVGATVSRCTGFNMKYIYDNKIGPGAVIKITRSGDVIPLILGIVHTMPFANS